VVEVSRSWITQFLQYITAILLLGLVAAHLAERIPWLWEAVRSYEETLSPAYVWSRYQELGPVLLLLAYAALFHGLNGVRGILLEWRDTRAFRLAVNIFMATVFIIFAAIATHSILALSPP